jgi:hypothetical protein
LTNHRSITRPRMSPEKLKYHFSRVVRRDVGESVDQINAPS